MTNLIAGVTLLERPLDNRRWATWTDTVDLESIGCEMNPGHRRAGRRITPLSVEVPAAAMRDSLIWTWQGDCLISNSAAAALRLAGVSDFETRQAEVTSPNGSVIHGYEELVVTGWAGIAHAESGIALVESCPGCGLLRYSAPTDWTKIIDRSQWIGAEMFMVWPLPRYTFILQRVVDIMVGRGLTGFTLTSLKSKAPQSGDLTPGRVSYWIPETVLRSLAVTPGIV